MLIETQLGGASPVSPPLCYISWLLLHFLSCVSCCPNLSVPLLPSVPTSTLSVLRLLQPFPYVHLVSLTFRIPYPSGNLPAFHCFLSPLFPDLSHFQPTNCNLIPGCVRTSLLHFLTQPFLSSSVLLWGEYPTSHLFHSGFCWFVWGLSLQEGNLRGCHPVWLLSLHLVLLNCLHFGWRYLWYRGGSARIGRLLEGTSWETR